MLFTQTQLPQYLKMNNGNWYTCLQYNFEILCDCPIYIHTHTQKTLNSAPHQQKYTGRAYNVTYTLYGHTIWLAKQNQ